MTKGIFVLLLLHHRLCKKAISIVLWMVAGSGKGVSRIVETVDFKCGWEELPREDLPADVSLEEDHP
ncbi:hypothetical protein [Neorhizobium sp. NCHU2750]|uniref:hypothetical protein n=1 Tax=Neorhizobium sp. NCHU2750 TaxID=1825976 RepID=UPI0013C52C9A